MALVQSIATTFILSVIILVTGKGQADAVTRTCRWNINPVPMKVNRASFAARGYTAAEIDTSVVNAMRAWNIEGESQIRITYAGDSAATSAPNGEILILAGDTSGTCDIASTAVFGGNCTAATITVYDRLTNGGCAGDPHANPLDYVPDAAAPGQHPLSSILVKQLGRAIGGYTDDYGNVWTVMQGQVSGFGPSLHLYNVDISLLQNGSGAITGYGRRGDPVRGVESSDGITWAPVPGGVLGQSAYRPAAAASSNHKVLAFVDTTPGGINLIKVRRFAAGVWSAASGTGDSAVVGLALAYGAGFYLLAYVSPADTREIMVRSSSDGVAWGPPVAVATAARTQSAPALAFNASAGRFNLFWTDVDTDRLMYSTSSNAGSSWRSPAAFGDRKEHFSLDGGASACDPSGQCFMLWPSWNRFNGISTPLCLQKYSNGGAGQLVPGDAQCEGINTGSSPGLAYKAGSGWLAARAGKDVFNTLATELKATFSTSSLWGGGVVHSWATAAGVDALLNPANGKFEVYFVSR